MARRKSRQVAATESEGYRLFREFALGANLAEIAREAGVTRAAIAALLAGKMGPSIELALKIERVSYGKVSIASWAIPATPRHEDAA